MPGIFISYRHADSRWIMGRISDQLEAHFGPDSVFVDIDDIPAGRDFREQIRATLARCDVLLALIGPQWREVADGKDRLHDEGDWVRIEIETALEKNIPVIPLLIDQAQMPKESDLPDCLHPLAFRQAQRLDTGIDFHPHMQRLMLALDAYVAAQGVELNGAAALSPRPGASNALNPTEEAAVLLAAEKAKDAAKEAEARAVAAKLRQADARKSAEDAERACERALEAARMAGNRVDGYSDRGGEISPGRSIRYAGQVTNGTPNGFGVIGIADKQNGGSSERYEGELKYGQPSGRGVHVATATSPNGDRYERYAGDFKEGYFDGLGVIAIGDVQKYEGEFRDNGKNGLGVTTFTSGERYEGEYKNNYRDGLGVYYSGNDSNFTKVAGQFANDGLSGYAIKEMKDGRRLEGAWKDGKLEGYAAIFDPQGGVIAHGFFAAGVLQAPRR